MAAGAMQQIVILRLVSNRIWAEQLARMTADADLVLTAARSASRNAGVTASSTAWLPYRGSRVCLQRRLGQTA